MRRYKRFLADVEFADGTVITAACPNTGSMLGLETPGARVLLSRSDSATRKYPHTWEMVETTLGDTTSWVGINTSHPNWLVEEAIASGAVAALAGYPNLRREVGYGVNSRIDLLLEANGRADCYVEVKNVHLARRPGLAEFPDCVTERGRKHLHELRTMVAEGQRAVMVYLVQRSDCASFAFARDLDPLYMAAFDEAAAAGVEAIVLGCRLTPEEVVVDRILPMDGSAVVTLDVPHLPPRLKAAAGPIAAAVPSRSIPRADKVPEQQGPRRTVKSPKARAARPKRPGPKVKKTIAAKSTKRLRPIAKPAKSP